MAFTRSADLKFPLIGKPKDRLFFSKLPTNSDLMQRFLYYFKCEILSKQKSINRTSDEVVLLWQNVAEGSTPGYSCVQRKLSIVQRKLGVRGDEQTNASKIYMAKLESLFDIAKPDIE